MYTIRRQQHSILLLLLAPLLLTSFTACRESFKKNKSHQQVPDNQVAAGQALAVRFCQSCHLLPDPSQLSASAWENGVLPAMGPHFGIFAYGFSKYPSYRSDKDLPRNYYPSTPVISSVQWQSIIDYYTSLAPDSMPPQPPHDSIHSEQAVFSAGYANLRYPSPAVCLTQIDTARHQLFVFDLAKQSLFVFNPQLQLTDSVSTAATITSIDNRNDSLLACNIGVINPNNGKFGKAQRLYTDKNNKLQLDTAALFGGMGRPVKISSCDLNNDGKTDYLVCEFGHLIGALSWMENKGDGSFERHVLRAEPGALMTYTEDVNHDGLQDVWALFSQGNESIVLFMNKGKGQFDQQQVLRFPAINGSTYFEFADINKDGRKDIIYTCGDNADFSVVLKPYHGVYIFLNEGNNHFTQQYFYPINGCYKAMARDFDADGDLDIAAIGFSADFAKKPEEGFVYLENKGNWQFRPSTLPACSSGRWLTMDAGDIDGDGKPDIVLGNFSIRPSDIQPHPAWEQGPPFMVLKNISKK
ncbi:MAG TPA: VCBS repeat-containing protein [Chitinophagaceae bacterium]|nr:VCBS repeat-containing protein [Chitinophagaceae bacterium]